MGRGREKRKLKIEEGSRPEQRARDHPNLRCNAQKRHKARKALCVVLFVESPTFQKFGALAQGLH